MLRKEYSYNAIQSQLQPIPEVTNWSEKFYDIKQHFDKQVDEM